MKAKRTCLQNVKQIVTMMIAVLFIIGPAEKTLAQDNKIRKDGDILLSKWKLKSTVLEKGGGQQISVGHDNPEYWYAVRVPTTVLSGLIANGVYPDPRLDMNNYLIPDISDTFNTMHDLTKYSYLPNHVNPWKDPYWFKTDFTIPDNERGKQVWLNFDGINYRGEVWLNGKRMADSSEMVGMFKRFKFNVTSAVKDPGTNYLAVKIYPVDHPGIPGTQMKVFGNTRGPDEDLFKDETLKISGGWDCALPARDRNMGIYQRVYLSFTGNVDISDPYVVTTLTLPDTTVANLTISATLSNVSNENQTGLLKGKIDLITNVDMGSFVKHYPGSMKSVTFKKEVTVPANGKVSVTLSYKDFSELTIKQPHLWWPNGNGQQYLHNLELAFIVDGKESAVKNTIFGIREVTSRLKELNGHHGRIFYINGQRIFCKGGWLQPDMLLDNSKKDIYDQARLIANANLNIVSSEDMPVPPEDFMNALDKYGLMWWEVFYQCYVTVPGTNSSDNPLDHRLAKESTQDIILRYRNNPSVTAWCTANESLPDSDLYFALKDQLKNLDTTRTFLASTAIWWDWKKLSPYIKDDLPVGTTDNGTPDYTWYPLPYYFNKVDEIKDNMFHNELGMDAVPTLSSLKKIISRIGGNSSDSLFPLDSVWAEHGAWDAGGYAFKPYYYAIRNYYGFRKGSVADFCRAAQLANADNYRAMFEAPSSRMWQITSGVMIWKLNASYPDFAWEMYDWFLNPNAGYYYVKRACEPLHIQLNANDHRISVVNMLSRRFDDLRIRAEVYDFSLKVKWEHESKVSIGGNSSEEEISVPSLTGLTPVYFVRLELENSSGKVLSSNLYWESTGNLSGWTSVDDSNVTKIQSHFESPNASPLFSDLSKLENTKLNMTYKSSVVGSKYRIIIRVKNPTNRLAIMNRLAIIRKDDGEEVLPTFWTDNFIWLFPGEEKEVEARFSKEDLKGSEFSVIVDDNM